MNLKTIKILISLFMGILCVFLGLMAVDRYGAGKPLSEFSASAQAERILVEIRTSANTKENASVSYRTGLTTESVRSEGAIMIVKSREYEGVAEDPQSMMDMLTDMSGSNKKKPLPIDLTGKNLEKGVLIMRSDTPESPISVAAVPELGKSASAIGSRTMISAPVDYTVFRDSATWMAFASTHKGHFPKADFSREEMLILVSVSDLPSGIFKIDGLKRSAKETVVLYRVDPLAMAADNAKKEQNFYSAIAIPKTIDVKLEQIP